MRFETVTRPLRVLINEFNKGEIQLPQFQRDYVWRPNKIRNLLDSLLKGFPIGGFYLWRPTGGHLDVKTKAYGNHVVASKFEGYLIDGQQRLTSLEAAFSLFTGEDKRGFELRCFLDLAAPDAEWARDTRLFVSFAGSKSVARRVEAGDSTLISLQMLFDGPNQDLRRTTEEALRTIPGWKENRIQSALMRFDRTCEMLNQGVPVTTVLDATDREAVEVFRRLNKGGTALSQGDVHAAELARGHAVEVLKEMREFVSLKLPLRLGFGFSFAFRALVVFHRGSAQFSTLKADWMDMPGPHGRTLMQSWRAAKRALEKALSFADERMGWSRRSLLPSTNAVIVLAFAFDKASFKIDPDTDQLYQRWLCLTALRGVFQGSVESTINRFLRAVSESKKAPAKSLVEALKRNAGRVRVDELNTIGQPWGPTTQVIHALLVGKEAKDWLSGDLVDALPRGGNPSLPGGDLTVHHIFARGVLADMVENQDTANTPANYALLS